MKFSTKLMGLTALFAMTHSPFAWAQTPNGTAGHDEHILNFDDVALSVMIADIATVTGYTFIVHPDARSKRITLSSTKPLTASGIFDVFLATLRVHGFTAVPSGKGIYRVIPEKSGVQSSAFQGRGKGDSITTEVFKLTNFSAQEAARMVRPIIDEQGTVIANRQSNTLVVVDYRSNLPRIRKIIERVDITDLQFDTIPLENIPATEMANILTTLFNESEESNFGTNFRAIAASVGNNIVLRGDALSVTRAKSVAERLDTGEQSKDTLRVITLNNADAVDVVPILEQVSKAISARKNPSASNNPSTIAHHEATNSLVISAPSETLLALEKVISDLDKRRAQVLVEAIIVEMSDDAARELGVQFLLSGSDNSTIPFTTTNFSRSAPNLLTISGALADTPLSGTGGTTTDTNAFQTAAISSLLNLEGLTFGLGGESGQALFGAVLTAVEDDNNSRILSKPFTMTLDNGTSSILVGQEVPVSTGEALGDNFTNTFRTVQREEIGVSLNVTPRIGADDTIRLEIEQKISSLASVVGGSIQDPVFNERSIATSVIADNGEIIVLGGLIEQQEAEEISKVPILGDTPVIGPLFRSRGVTKSRTNLMVFIRPTIIKTQEDAEAQTIRNYRYVRAEQLWEEGDNSHNPLDAFVSEVLGPDAVPGGRTN